MRSIYENIYNDHTEEAPLTPSYHGRDCLGNGEHQEYECLCDECDFYLVCFPDWRNYEYYIHDRFSQELCKGPLDSFLRDKDRKDLDGLNGKVEENS